MENDVFVFVLIISSFLAVFIILYQILRSPFHYPYFIIHYDITGKRSPQPEDLIDEYLNEGRIEEIRQHDLIIQQWKQECEQSLEHARFLKEYRSNQYRNCIDDDHAYVFRFTRTQTRYMQRNYVRMPYESVVPVKEYACCFGYLLHRNVLLSKIGHECTLREYHSKEQRKLMTKELRQKIMVRDHFTCQLCGKYMPDGVGLQIDHIQPIAKGGKTVPSNLQVLCSKCNAKKSTKVYPRSDTRDRTTIYL